MNPSSPRRRRLLALFAAPLLSPGLGQAAPRISLAQEAPSDIDPAGYLVSEKYDGARALWDGRTLRFRSGAVIAAPSWFTAALPAEPLDGELWLGRGRFEALSAAVRRQRPDEAEWRPLKYMVFEAPHAPGRFSERASYIEALLRHVARPMLVAVAQRPVADRAALQARLKAVIDGGGEGLVLHRAAAPYRTGRSADVQKLKPLHDAEARVIAYLPGHGKHAGRLGALRVRTPEGIEFSIGTGFSDAQRAEPPPIGSVVSYTHRGRTAGEVPRFASFLRVREV